MSLILKAIKLGDASQTKLTNTWIRVTMLRIWFSLIIQQVPEVVIAQIISFEFLVFSSIMPWIRLRHSLKLCVSRVLKLTNPKSNTGQTWDAWQRTAICRRVTCVLSWEPTIPKQCAGLQKPTAQRCDRRSLMVGGVWVSEMNVLINCHLSYARMIEVCTSYHNDMPLVSQNNNRC